MIQFPNAKINLGLNIVNKRPDNYHNLNTIFLPIPLTDTLEITSNEENKFCTVGHLDCQKQEDNLIYKAYKALAYNHDIPPFAAILNKNIPTGAGLGGGSSDAAFMLKMLNDFAFLRLSNSQLEAYASRIGADCPFFINNSPAYAEGIGDILSPINIDIKGYKLLLVKPNIHVSTQQAYAMVTPHPWDTPLIEAIQRPIDEWKHFVFNDFEHSVFTAHPALADIKQSLYDCGASYASMSGSGSSIFGIFPSNASQPKIIFPNTENSWWLTL